MHTVVALVEKASGCPVVVQEGPLAGDFGHFADYARDEPNSLDLV